MASSFSAPHGEGHDPTLYLEPRSDRSTPAFFTNASTGELWVGPRRGVEETAYLLGVDCAPLDGLGDAVRGLDGPVLVLRGLDPAVDALVAAPADPAEERRLARELSELRLVKDDHEIRMLERAVAATVRGFEDVVRALPEAMEQGERVVEGVFNLRARVEGNDVGYETIAASGAHATFLHWSKNDGEVRSGDLLLLDAGVESEELYTADVTRTLPVSGRFTADQRRLYELVHRAQRAAIAEVRPGAAFLDPHRAAMRVLAEGLEELGILTVGADDGARRGPAAPPPLHPPRHLAHARPRRPRLRSRPRAGVPGGHAPRRATCSPSSPASTSSPTTSPSPSRCGGSASGSRTTSW